MQTTQQAKKNHNHKRTSLVPDYLIGVLFSVEGKSEGQDVVLVVVGTPIIEHGPGWDPNPTNEHMH